MHINSILASGVQPWNHNVCCTGGKDRFAYCSTLAIYMYKLDSFNNFVLDKIVAGHKDRITAITWSPHNIDLVASCSVEKRLSIWDITNEKHIRSFASGQHVLTCLDWSPHDPSLLAYGTDQGAVKIINYLESTSHQLKDHDVPITAVRWNPKVPKKLVVGDENGGVFLYDVEANTKKRIKTSQQVTGVVDLHFDPLSENYLLVGFKSGVVVLFDTETEMEIQVFEMQSTGVTALSWVPTIPGGFVTTDGRSGVIRLWSVSQKTPLELIKLKKSGFHNFLFAKGSTRALCAFKDGSVGVYDLGVRKWEFLGEPGHTETIFDCQFKSANPDILATASFDGTVKLWNIKTMKCIDTLNANEGIIYGIAWAPGNDDRLIAASSKGPLVLWDTKRGQLLLRYDHHKDSVYRCAWNPLDPSLIASCSRDGYCVVFKVEGTVTHRLKMPKPAYGCDWSPLQKNMLVTGCQDAVVRVFDISKKGDHLVKTLKGHTERVFNTVWSPLLPNLLMSGSDDKTVRVWHIDSDRVHVLSGHTENVRALVWHTEIPFMVLTGSWDGTIRIWDFRTQVCLSVVWDHHADVYGLTCHPQRPFVFASSSRDTTLRVWTMAREAARARVSALYASSWASIIGEVDQVMNDDAMLAGRASKELVTRAKACKTEAQRAQLIFDFFNPPNGGKDLWDLVVGMDGKSVADGKDRGENLIVRNDELAQNTLAKAQELESVRNGGAIGAARKEDRLALAAAMYLKLGNLEKYCGILAELGQWERALAIAPAVSMGFWRDLANKYSEYLSQADNGNSEAYLVATGNIPKLVDFYVKRGQFDDALLVAQLPIANRHSAPLTLPPLTLAQVGANPPVASSPIAVPTANLDGEVGSSIMAASASPTTIIHPSVITPSSLISNSPISSSPRGGAIPKTPPSPSIANYSVNSQLIYQISNNKAAQYYYNARPVMAACAHLACGDAQHAIHKLLKGNEVEMAAMLAKILRIGPADHVYQALAARCENLGLWELAVEILRMTKRPVQELSALCTRAQAAAHEKVDVAGLYQKAELRTRDVYGDTAKEMEKQGRMLDAIRCYLLAGDHDTGLKLSLGELRKLISQESWDPFEAHVITQMMGSAKLDTATTDKSKRAELLAYSGLVGAYIAIWKGYFTIVPRMLATARKMVNQAAVGAPQAGTSTALLAPITANIISCSVLYSVATRSVEPPVEDIPVELRTSAQSYAQFYSANPQPTPIPHHAPPQPLNANLIIVAGSNLPARVRAACESIITKRPVLGPEVVLDDGSVMSLSEALMWAQVNPFSPTCTGKFLNPN